MLAYYDAHALTEQAEHAGMDRSRFVEKSLKNNFGVKFRNGEYPENYERCVRSATGICPAQQVLGAGNTKLANLRNFRDSRLANSAIVRKAIQIYYSNAGSINDTLERNPALRAATRKVLEVFASMAGNN